MAFLGRVLQHVLPHGFTTVRHYGLFSPSRRDLLARAREHLLAASTEPPAERALLVPALPPVPNRAACRRCPACGIGILHVVDIVRPCGQSP